MQLLLAILPLVLKIGSFWLDLRGATKEEKLKWLGDFQAMQAKVSDAVTVRKQALELKDQMSEWEKQQDSTKGNPPNAQ